MMHTPNRASVEADLILANAQAKRAPCVFGVCAPSDWDERHAAIDWLLYEWELAD